MQSLSQIVTSTETVRTKFNKEVSYDGQLARLLPYDSVIVEERHEVSWDPDTRQERVH